MEKRYNLAQLSSILRQIITSQGPSLSKVTIKNYVSDLRHFLSWFQSSKIDAGSNGNQLETLLSSSTLETYVSRLQVTSTPRTTINRRLSSIRLLSQFCAANNLAKNNQIANIKMRPKKIPLNVNEELKIETKPRPEVVNPALKLNFLSRIENPIRSLHSYMNKGAHPETYKVALLAFVAATLGFSLSSLLLGQSKAASNNLYQKISSTANSQDNLAAARPILYQGILKDSLGNPIVDPKPVQFKLYASSQSVNPLYESGTCKTTPNKDGSFAVLIGNTSGTNNNTCGTSLPSSLFSGAQQLFLGVTIGADREMKPRQPLATSALSSNALMVDGFKPGTTEKTIPFIDHSGSILLAAQAPHIGSSSQGTFSITSARAMQIEVGANSDMVFVASQSGNIRFRTVGAYVDQFTIAQNGNVGVNNPNPTQFKLEIGGSVGPALDEVHDLGSNTRKWNTVFTRRLCFDKNDCITKDSLGGLEIQTADFAELYPTQDDVQYGDVVTLGETIVQTIDGDSIRKLQKSQSSNDTHIIGVVSNNHDKRIVVGNNLMTHDNPLPIALTGRVPVNMSKNSPAILAGDYLTSSTDPGRATKASRAGVMIGRALEDWNPESGKDSIMVFVHTSYANPTTKDILTQIGETLSVTNLTAQLFQSEKIYSPVIETQNLDATSITTQDLNAHSATISGTLTAQQIEAKNITELEERIANAVENTQAFEDNQLATNLTINEIQAQLADLPTQISDTPDYSPLSTDIPISDTQLLTQSLVVTETASIFNLSLSGTLKSTQDELHISALSRLNLMDGAVTVTKEGNIIAKGTITAKGGIRTNTISAQDDGGNLNIDLKPTQEFQVGSSIASARIDASGSAAFQSLTLSSASSSAIIAAADNLSEHGVYASAIETHNSSVGIGHVPPGETRILIYNDSLQKSSHIFLTPQTQTAASNLTLGAIEQCETTLSQQNICKKYFEVLLHEPLSIDLPFNWLIIDGS